MLTTAYRFDGPSAVRYPRGTGPGAEIAADLEALPIGKGTLRREGSKVAILAFGAPVAAALAAADKLDATVADLRFVKPLDRDLIQTLAQTHDLLVTVEENAVAGGAGEAVAEVLSELGLSKPILHLGLPDRFVEQGEPTVLLARVGLDAAGIETAIKKTLAE